MRSLLEEHETFWMSSIRQEIYDKVNEIWDIGRKGQGINLTGYTLAIMEIFEKYKHDEEKK